MKRMKRTPDQIDNVLNCLGDVWKRTPDLRFGQFLIAVFGFESGDMNPHDYFYSTDDDLIECIDAWAEENLPPVPDTPKQADEKPIVSNANKPLNQTDINFLVNACNDVCKKMLASQATVSKLMDSSITMDDMLFIMNTLYESYLDADTETKTKIRDSFLILLTKLS